MSNVPVARRYARALLDASGAEADQVLVQLETLATYFDGQPVILAALSNPTLTRPQRMTLVETIISNADGLQPVLANLMKVLIDRNRHVRRAVVPKVKVDQPGVVSSNRVVPFDFRQAAEWDEKGLITGTNLSNVQRMEELLGETIATLLSDKGDAKERKSPAVLVTVGIGFALFFILLILKTKASRNHPSTT